VIPQYCLWSAYKHANEGQKKLHYEIAEGWAKASEKTGIYEYYINGSWPGLHRLFVPYIAESIKHLHGQGIDLYQTQSGDDFAINGINYYIAGKLLWDTSQDEQALLSDFYEKGFGRAAEPIRRFHHRLEEAWRQSTAGGTEVTAQSLEGTRILELFTKDLLESCARDLAEAEGLADTDLIRKRVEFYRKGLRYTELTVNAVEAAKRLETEGVHVSTLEKARQEIQQVEREKARKMVAEALDAWKERAAFVEAQKNDFVLAYFWVIYSDTSRKFNPTKNLEELLKGIEQS
jgi:hypothetical protein